MWDPEGREYLDFLSGICAVAPGHCHPKIVATLTEQVAKVSLPSRVFYGETFGPFAEYATRYFGYDRLLMMNTGVEAVETAIKLCRKWGYTKKRIPVDQAKIVFCSENFHGRTVTAISASSNPDSKNHFGPLLPGFVTIPYNHLEALEQVLKDPHVAGFLVEPVQGEGGVVVPTVGYLSQAKSLCEKSHTLFIADEVQTGLGRTGKRLACDHEGVHPDILILGKALSGGTIPISAILADDPVMECFQPGDHGSTFGGNPLACAVALTACKVIEEEGLIENAAKMGEIFRSSLQDLPYPVKEVRGKGLLNAIEFDTTRGFKALDFCMRLKENGLLTKNTRDSVIRFAPPLNISQADMHAGITKVGRTFVDSYASL